MKKRNVIILGLIVLILVLPIFVDAKVEKISKNNIEEEFNSGKEFVNVLIQEKPSQSKIATFSLRETKNKVSSKEVTYEEYLEMSEDESLIVEYNFKIKTLLQQSTKIIRANNSWVLNSLGLNLTGKGQTVCIIDTGINYSHPDFGSCTSVGSGGSCRVIGGYDFGNNDADPMDVDGHGTHVAGIVAANGGITGVAPDTNIVAIKVFNDSGDGTTNEILEGIDWCIDHKTEYNISVISMSLGLVDGSNNPIVYDHYCDDEGFDSLRNAINSAVVQNITVAAASGNEYETGKIGVPACIQNATPVSSTKKEDMNISSFANKWNNTLLRIIAAPGENINSTMLFNPYDYTGSDDLYAECEVGHLYCSISGTSMATPHVAGAIAIINQYLLSVGQTKTPDQIEDLLNSTGKQIYDSYAERFFSRIDIYSALMEVDATNPEVNLSSPSNNNITLVSNQTFVCNVSDWQLKNITLYVWNSTNEIINISSVNITGTSNSSSFNVTNMQTGTYKWNCLATDEKGNNAFATNNFTLNLEEISLTLVSPQNETYTKTNETTFNCSAITNSDRQLKNMTFYLYENGTLANSTFVNITGNNNSSLFNYTFVNQTDYVWGCEVYSNNSDYDAENYTIFYDITYPNITINSQTATTIQVTISWNTSEETNYSITLQDTQNSSFSLIHSTTIANLSASTMYNYNLTYCDRAGNCNLTEGSFTTADNPVTTSSSSGGGGGGGGSIQTKITETQLTQGYNKKYSAGEKVSFVSKGQNHSLQLNKIVNNSVNITLRSEPINLFMQSGEEKKINLSSTEYYDLYIKIENVTKYNANITILGIEELINPHKIIKYENQTNNETSDKGKKYNIFEDNEKNIKRDLLPLYATLIIIICAFFYFLLRRRLSRKDNKKE